MIEHRTGDIHAQHTAADTDPACQGESCGAAAAADIEHLRAELRIRMIQQHLGERRHSLVDAFLTRDPTLAGIAVPELDLIGVARDGHDGFRDVCA